jgi:hypothetical protein
MTKSPYYGLAEARKSFKPNSFRLSLPKDTADSECFFGVV